MFTLIITEFFSKRLNSMVYYYSLKSEKKDFKTRLKYTKIFIIIKILILFLTNFLIKKILDHF